MSHTQHSTIASASLSRRAVLRAAGMSAAAALLPLRPVVWAAQADRPKVAAVVTASFYRSHAHVILENFLEPYLFNGKRTDPGVEVVSIYFDQLADNDNLADISGPYHIPIFRSIDRALCLGGDRTAVDAVLSIGEHGKYPRNELGQVMYPRKRFFDEITAVMKRDSRPVPLFNDKHLSYKWEEAKQMVDTAKAMSIPFIAGSSVPLAQRIPPFEMPKDAVVAEAVSIHGGGVESYDFHGLEVLQSLIEFRRGGETGVTSVQFLSGDALWQAAEQGEWSIELAEAAMQAETGRERSLRDVIGGSTPHGLLLRYADGTRATVLKAGDNGIRWNFACRFDGDDTLRATRFHVGPWQNRNLFKALSHAIQHCFIHRKSPYPVERTLMTSGVLDAAMHSRHQGGKTLDTPHLRFAYAPIDFTAMREMGETWKIITDATPEPRGVQRVGID